MKKLGIIALSVLLVASVLFVGGCGEQTPATLKVGAGVYVGAPTATDATADKTGSGKIDVTIAAVTVDADGKIVACALALMMMRGMEYDFAQIAGFIFMLGITMVAAPGVPGGAIMASLGLLQSMLGFNQEAQALMIALYIAMDSFGTACNVTGDGAIALIVDKITKGSKS